jgi:5-hydroxyisourate hydrolase-like protein (transthyretin family)
MSARRRRCCATAALSVAVIAIAAAHASAATYHAFLCRVPYGTNAGTPAPTDAISFTHNSGITGSASDSCASGGSMSAALTGDAHNQGDGASLIYDVPGGLTLAGFTAWRHERVGPVGGSTAPFANVMYTGVASVEGQACQLSVGCPERGVSSPPLDAANVVGATGLSGVTQIRFDVFCGGAPGSCPATPAGTPTAVIDVFAADMLLNDATAPAVTGVTGPLLAGGPLTGAQSVTFKAADAGGGVYRGSLVVDGIVVSDAILDTGASTCADLGVAPDGRPSFAGTRPCPSALDGALTLNTDLLAAGTHALQVRVSDPAGNQTVAASATITTTGPLAPGTNNGVGASRFAKLTARHSSTPKRARRLGFSTRPTITGRLVDEAGKPIAGAAVDVLVRERRVGAPSERIATATTGADGSIRVQLPSGPSRTITVQYTAFAGDPKPAATVRLTALVRAQLSASVAPRSPRVGRPLRLTGRLRYLRRKGVDVAIQARDGRVWRTVDSVKTRSDGRFRWTYRFRSPASAGRRYVFRARVNSTIYPFSAGNSRAVNVRVRS